MKSAPLMVITVSIAPIVGYRSISLGEDAKHPECTVTVTSKVNSAAGTLRLTSLCILLLCVYLLDARFFIPLLWIPPIVGRRSNTPARPAHPTHCTPLRAGKLGDGTEKGRAFTQICSDLPSLPIMQRRSAHANPQLPNGTKNKKNIVITTSCN